MRVQSLSLSSVGVTPWMPVDQGQYAFNIGAKVYFDSVASGVTYVVEQTFDELGSKTYDIPVSMTRSGTLVTVTSPNHGLRTGDSVSVLGGNTLALDSTGVPVTSDKFDGVFDVTVSTRDVFTYNTNGSGNAVANPGVRYQGIRVSVNSNFPSGSVEKDALISEPVSALRLKVTALTDGVVTLELIQGRK